MTTPTTVPVGAVLVLLRQWQARDREAAELAIEALGSLDGQSLLDVASAEVSVLVGIYRGRIRRGAGLVGAPELLATLEELDDPRVLAAAVSVGGQSIGIWFDRSVSAIVAVWWGTTAAMQHN